MEHTSYRYNPRISILSLPSGVFDDIVHVLDNGPRSKNWRALIDLCNNEFRLRQLEIEEIAKAVQIPSTSPARQTFSKLESLGFTVGHLVHYLNKLRLEYPLTYLKKYERIRIISPPKSVVSLKEGDYLNLRVEASGFPYPRYQWFIGDDPIEGATEQVYENYSVTLKDIGEYCCRLHNSADPELCVFTEPTQVCIYQGSNSQIKPRFKVDQKSPPIIHQHPGSIKVPYGKDVRLQCSATGADILKYRWLFDRNIICDSQNSSLIISEANHHKAGDYQCLVYNDHGECLSNMATVEVAEVDKNRSEESDKAPLDIISQPKSVMVECGGVAMFRCKATCSLPISYQWFKDGVSLNDEKKSDLIISEVSMHSDGCYQCCVFSTDEQILSSAAYLHITDIGSHAEVSPYTATDKLALLIGNFNYEDPSVGELVAPRTDVHVLSECFRSMDFKVLSLLNLTRDEMFAVVEEFCQLLKDHEVNSLAGTGVYVVFYFCGHGFQDSSKQCHLLPVDAPTRFTSKHCLSAEYILDRIQKNQPALCCMILDCCRTLHEDTAELQEPIYQPQPQGNTLFFYATTFGMSAYEFEQEESSRTSAPSVELNGILVKHLQVYLCKKQPIETIFAQTREAISKNHQIRQCQIPEMRTNLLEPSRSLTDRIMYTGHTDAYTKRMTKWLYAKQTPKKEEINFKHLGVILEMEFQSQFSNVLSIFITVKDYGCCLLCRPVISELPYNISIMGQKVVSYEPYKVKIVLQDLQKLKESLKMSVGLNFVLQSEEKGCVDGPSVDLGYPLVSGLQLWCLIRKTDIDSDSDIKAAVDNGYKNKGVDGHMLKRDVLRDNNE